VGGAVARRLAERDYADLVLIDPRERWAEGRALDLAQAGALGGYEPKLVGGGGWEEAAGSQVVLVTAGSRRRPGESRDELLPRNREAVEAIAAQVAEHCPDAVVVMVTSPVDPLCALALRATGFPRARVVGMGGVLDSARFRSLLAAELGVSSRDVTALVLGAHGDTMVPIVSSAHVGGIPVTDKLPAERVAEVVRRTREGGAELLGLLGELSAYEGPAAGAVEMVDAIVLDRKRVLPCCACCQGELGLDGVCVGVPVRLGREGVEEIVEMHLGDDERAALRDSAEAVRRLTEAL
jgi:malate dehydrogenase